MAQFFLLNSTSVVSHIPQREREREREGPERERVLTDSSSIAVFTLLPCYFFGFLSRKLWACRSGDFELTGETFLVV
jgi:hypothetical protein